MFFGEAVGLGLNAIGLGAGIFGGAQQDSAAREAMAAQNEYNNQAWKYNWKEAKRDYQYSKDSRKIAIKNNKKELASAKRLLRRIGSMVCLYVTIATTTRCVSSINQKATIRNSYHSTI